MLTEEQKRKEAVAAVTRALFHRRKRDSARDHVLAKRPGAKCTSRLVHNGASEYRIYFVRLRNGRQLGWDSYDYYGAWLAARHALAREKDGGIISW